MMQIASIEGNFTNKSGTVTAITKMLVTEVLKE